MTNDSQMAAFREAVAGRLGLRSDASNGEILSAFDGARSKPKPTPASMSDDELYAAAWPED